MKKVITLLLIAFITCSYASAMGDLFKKKNLNEKQAEQVQAIAIYEADLRIEKLLEELDLPSNNPVAPDIQFDNSPGKLATALNVATNVGGMFGIPGIGKVAELIIGGMTATGVVGVPALQLYNNRGRKKIEVERDDAKEDAEDKRKIIKVVTTAIAKRPAAEFKAIKSDVKKKMDRKNLNGKFEDIIDV